MPVSHSSSLDKLLDYIPEVIEKTNSMLNKCIQNKQEETEKIINHMKKNKNQKDKEKNIESDEKQVKKEKTDYEFEYNEIKDIEDDLDMDD